MKVLILGGFLGSGKTSLMLRLARFLTESGGGAQRVAILENEIGEQGVDDMLLRSGGCQVKTLFDGCICCTLGMELVAAADTVRKEQNPDWMLIETTGLAYPGLIRDNLLHALGQESRICTVADASRWSRLKTPMEELLLGQIECAQTVLANKTDLASEEETAEMEADIRLMNPQARCIRTSALSEPGKEVWEQVLGVKI